MKQAAIIARVSTQTQNFERQISDLKALAKSLGYAVSGNNIYAERISGLADRKDRGELNRLIADINAGQKIQMVFTSEVSRIARDPDIATDYIKELLKLKVGTTIQNMNNLSSMNPNGSRNSMFFLILGILSEFARTELEYISSRMKSGKRKNFKEGRHMGGEFVPYGYDKGEKDDEYKAAKLVINKNEAKVVKTLFRMTTEGAGLKAVCNYLNSKKIKTKSGLDWQIGTLAQIVANTIYYGDRKYNIYGRNEAGERIIESTEVYEGIVPAIITKEEWEAANKASKERNVNPQRNVKYLYLLSNKVFCGRCGSVYSAKFRPKKHSHYMCGTRMKGKQCDNCGIGITAIESLAWSIVNNGEEFLKYLKNSNENVVRTEQDLKNLQLQLESYEAELEKKNDERRKWLRLFTIDKVTEDELNKEDNRILTTMNNLNDKIATTKQSIEAKQDWIKKHNSLGTYSAMLKDIGTDRVKINEVLPHILDKLIITSVTKGENCNWFIFTAFMYGETMPYRSVLFNKKTLEVYESPYGIAGIDYDKKGLMNFDINKVVENFKKPYTGKRRDGKEVHNEPSRKIELIPFTRLNTLDDLKPV